MARIFQQVDVVCVASKITTSNIFTSTPEVPRTLIKLWSLHKTANDDLVVYDDRELIVDIPVDMLPSTDDKVELNRKIKHGNVVRVGFREGNAATPTGAIVVESEIPD